MSMDCIDCCKTFLSDHKVNTDKRCKSGISISQGNRVFSLSLNFTRCPVVMILKRKVCACVCVWVGVCGGVGVGVLFVCWGM